MEAPRSTAAYLAELRRVTAAVAQGQHVEDAVKAVTAGLRELNGLSSVSVMLYRHDGECPVCQQQPPLYPSAERRLHRVCFASDDLRPPAPQFHALALGSYYSGRCAEQRRLLLIEDLPAELRALADAGGPERVEDAEHLGAAGVRTGIFLPMLARDELIGVLTVMASRPVDEEEASYLEVFALQAGTLVRNAQLYDQIEALTIRLDRENDYLHRAVREAGGFGGIVGTSMALRRVLDMVQQVAPTDTTVLLSGETGTGKELIARAIHDASARSARALIKVNCGAIPSGLVESEFFGHERGAFTGAHQRRIGSFELADRGTLFLDEVGELTADTQVRLLRVLQDGEFTRVGGERPIRVDVRLLAATNRDLAEEVAAGRFRSDLYYRLNVLHIALPPLRARRADIPALAKHFVTHFARKLGKPFAGIAPRSMDLLMRYDWPGNIRELQNVIERACVLSRGPLVEIADPAESSPIARRAGAGSTLAAVERQHLLETLERVGWRIEGSGGAAELLGLRPSTLRSRLRKLAVMRPAP